MVPPTVERRIAELEQKVALLMGKTRPDFLETMIGVHANSPLFEEMVRSLEEEREGEREEARRLALQDEVAP